MRENGIEAAVKKVNALFSVYVAVIKRLVKNHRYRRRGKRRKCSRYGTLPMKTEFKTEKTRTIVNGVFENMTGTLKSL